MRIFIGVMFCSALIGPRVSGESAESPSLDRLELLHVSAEKTIYHGRAAVRIVQSLDQDDPRYNTLAILAPDDFRDGTIEINLASSPRPGVLEIGSGFLGIAFHVQPGASAYEMFYLRPTNARATDQQRRNHTTQYISFPDWPWERTRQETPGRYESYIDLAAGEWTKVKIVVAGTTAQLFVNGAEQPCLVVNDLKLGQTQGGIALWVGSGTEAYFTKLHVVRATRRAGD